PSRSSDSIITSVSSLLSAFATALSNSLSAASTSARFVMLLLPGTRTVAAGGFVSGFTSSLSGYVRGDSLIPHPHQEQPLRRGGRAGLAAVLGVQDFRDAGFGDVPAADVDQRAGDRADHVVQEAVSLDVDPDVLAGAVHA